MLLASLPEPKIYSGRELPLTPEFGTLACCSLSGPNVGGGLAGIELFRYFWILYISWWFLKMFGSNSSRFG